MTQATEASAPTLPPAHADRPAPSPPVRTRRRAPVIAAGVVLVAVGTLASAVLLNSAGNSVSVFVTGSEILRGEPIDASELREIQLAGDEPVDAFTIDDASRLVDRYAAVDLPAGSLLTSANTAEQVGVPDGQSMVGVPLGPGQMPASRIVAGDHVRLVATQLLDATGRPASETVALPVEAVVAAVTRDETDTVTIVDVLVPTTEAASLASRAAAGTLALILDPMG
ncbi:hypothetical protein [Microbacterium sp. No. 7]|uniref:hypothetical protein n=1 Tax=Microbacterium sp. No. 7 TaxID=1714373 RepID=UPI0006ED1EDD|nr:hypothetical protein [Microbacterium sp. No. 7]ALJ21429.1 hypothetical protein AOA12_16615 [Microbacterium sp. No. 7]